MAKKRKKTTLLISQQEWLGVYMSTAQGLTMGVDAAAVETEEEVEELANGIDDIATAIADLAADALEERFGAGGGDDEEDDEEDDED